MIFVEENGEGPGVRLAEGRCDGGRGGGGGVDVSGHLVDAKIDEMLYFFRGINTRALSPGSKMCNNSLQTTTLCHSIFNLAA